jgi:hypothetical protein
MKLIRFGKIGSEKPGLCLDSVQPSDPKSKTRVHNYCVKNVYICNIKTQDADRITTEA